MRGITRPCRHTMDPALKKRWMSHLCGLCLTIREEAGQTSRLLTGYDVLLLSVLVEAQAGQGGTEKAGRCPLRGMRTADVVPASDPGARLAAAGSLLAGAAAVEDKVRDEDLPGLADPVASRWADRASTIGHRLAREVGFDGDSLSRAARDAAAAEIAGGSLDDLLAPSGRGVAALFAHTAEVAGKPANADALRRAGEAFGKLVHLLDAVDDYRADERRTRFNPLAATATPAEEARRLAATLVQSVRDAMADVEMVDPDLALALLGPVLERSVAGHFAAPEPASLERISLEPVSRECRTEARGRARIAAGASFVGRSAAAVTAAAAAPVVMLGIFGGGRRRPPYYNDPYTPPGYGYGYRRRRGPSCCDLLACDCCANMACNDCCGGDDDCCVCCC